jgi:hypothetical protein
MSSILYPSPWLCCAVVAILFTKSRSKVLLLLLLATSVTHCSSRRQRQRSWPLNMHTLTSPSPSTPHTQHPHTTSSISNLGRSPPCLFYILSPMYLLPVAHLQDLDVLDGEHGVGHAVGGALLGGQGRVHVRVRVAGRAVLEWGGDKAKIH